jgi:hypothetical protein
MARPQTMFVWFYLDCRLEVQDDGGEGWIVRIYDAQGAALRTLRSRIRNGLELLLTEARQKVDHAYGMSDSLH